MARWSRRWRRPFESLGIRILAATVRGLPRKVGHSVGTMLGRFAFDVVRIRRKVAVRNVMERLAPEGGEREAERIARASYAVMGRTFMDLVRLDRIEPADTDGILSPADVAVFRALEREGRGGVLLSGHFGNWECLGLAVRRLGLPLQVVAADQANSTVDEQVTRSRLAAGIGTLSSRRGVREILRALREGRFVATLLDQDARRKGIFVDFLGVPASTHTGMLSLAVRTGSPVLALVLVDQGGGYRGIVADVWRPRPEVDEAANVRAAALHFNRFLEARIREHPENYFWAHRRWKTKAPAGDRPGSPETVPNPEGGSR